MTATRPEARPRDNTKLRNASDIFNTVQLSAETMSGHRRTELLRRLLYI